jgi:hypothetical protein
MGKRPRDAHEDLRRRYHAMVRSMAASKGMRFVEWWDNVVVPMIPGLDELHRWRVVEVVADDPRVGFQVRARKEALEFLSLEVRHLVRSVLDERDGTGAALWAALIEMVGDGPKLYRPRQRECEALAQVAPRVPVSEYRQPFPTYVVELPLLYQENKVTPGSHHILGEVVQHPVAVLVCHRVEVQLLCVIVLLQTSQALVLSLPLVDDHLLLDDLLTAASRRTTRVGSLDCINAAEQDLLLEVGRIALNASLLLTRHGARVVGGPDEVERRRLAREARVQAGEDLDAGIAAARLAHRLPPVVVGFDQHIRVYEGAREGPPVEGPGGGGGTPRPHWRSGHWVRQVCGAGRLDRVLQFRPPVLVNEHLFAGPLSNTRVTMTTASKLK